MSKFFKKFKIFYDKNPSVGSFFVFFLVSLLGFLFFFDSTGTLFRDDHFFHFKYAYLLRTHGFEINNHFDWMYLTKQITEGSVQRATLFQLALIPFTFIKDLSLGLKISDIFWASSTLSLIYYSFRKLNISCPLILVSSLIAFDFSIVRLLAGRTFVFSLGLIFLLIYFAIKEKYYKFFIVSTLCIFWHPAIFFMPLIIIMIVEIARYIIFGKINGRGIAGYLISVILASAYFSFNTFVDFFIFFKKLLLGVARGEGSEMYKMNIFQIAHLSEIFLLMLFLSFAFVLYIHISNINFSKRKNSPVTLIAYVAFLFLLTSFGGAILINGRFIDYYGVGVVFLIGSCISYLKQEKYIIESNLQKFLLGGIFIFLFVIGTATFTNMQRIISSNDTTPHRLVAEWVSKKSSDKDKVYLYNWSDFPITFFFNDKNIYSVGMDPMQLFYFDEELYWKWYNIFNNGIYCDVSKDCSGQVEKYLDSLKSTPKIQAELIEKENNRKIIESIKNDFQAKYIISDNGTKDLFESNPDLIANSFSAESKINGNIMWGYELK